MIMIIKIINWKGMITVLSTRLQNADHLDGNFGDDDDDNGLFALFFSSRCK